VASLGPPGQQSASPRPILTLRGHEARVTAVVFSPHGRHLASASDDDTVKTWDVPALLAMVADCQKAGLGQKETDTTLARQAQTFTGHAAGVVGVAYSPDGRLLASAGDDWTVRLWEASTGRELRVLKGHNASVNCVAFSPNGQQLASGSGEGSRQGEVKIWDVATGQELLTLKTQDRTVRCLTFSRDGQRLAAGIGSAARAYPSRPLELVCIWDTRPLTDDVRREREAANLYRAVAEELLLREQIIDRLQRGNGVADAIRRQARAWADHYREDPGRLREVSWAIVRQPGAMEATYEQARHWAEVADRLEPGKGACLTTLGAAQYRVGQYQAALATLTRADQLNAASGESTPADLAFLAMTQYRLGQKVQASALLARLRTILKNPNVIDWTKDDEAQDFLREAEEVVQAKKP
jgi:hypothetical protein